MEYLIAAVAVLGFVVILIFIEFIRAKKEEKEYKDKIRTKYLSLNERKYSPERWQKINSYYLRHPEEGQIDDITWNDCGMDDIFKRINYTLSSSGEEYLYYRLRTLRQNTEDIEDFENLVCFIDEHEDVRAKMQFVFHTLGYLGKYSIFDYIDNLDILGEPSNTKHYIFDFLFIPLIAIMFINFPVGIIGFIALLIYNMIAYFKDKHVIDPFITSFAYILRMKQAAAELSKFDNPELKPVVEKMRAYSKALSNLSKGSFWVMSPTRGHAADPLSAILDYFRMMLHLDLIKFNKMLAEVRKHREDIDGLITDIGYLDTIIAVWIYRKSLGTDWSIPMFTDENELNIVNLYHPLLTNPVKNSIRTEKGVLLTGSNASGKSTFLKSVEICTILAQSINTCCSDEYKAPLYRVYSSMSLRDDLLEGDSYYIVEIKALKRIIDVEKQAGNRVLCFVDEVLRGTNTVERIAASSRILDYVGDKMQCFAATHDIELTELLKSSYENYHFEEEIRDGDVHFNYQLLPGKATTRNAIKLLDMLGYEKSIVDDANARAQHFLQNGVWM